MTQAYTIEPVRDAAAFVTLRALFREYQVHINVDLCFQDFETELANVEQIYAAPRGAAFLARVVGAEDRAAVACVALKLLEPTICEMKRLYVRPEHRRASLGRALVAACVRRARELGYVRMRLDTLASMTAAQTLYQSLGFVVIEPYYHNPHPETCFMERRL